MFYPQKSHSEQRENDSEAIAYTRLFSSGDSALQIMIIKYKLPHDRNACDHTMSRSDFSKACWLDFVFVKNYCFPQVSKKECKYFWSLL